ncbi:MAG TPA: hypothetical protein PLG38_04080 [Propionibacteriaceae bacterium]|nr:hypothetical protein [Propionibacteriaceae bacterium]
MTNTPYGDFPDVLTDAPSDAVGQGDEVEVDTTALPDDEVMPADYNPGRSYAVDPDVSSDGLPTSS